MPTYRPGEVAQLLDVSIDTVRRWTDSGSLKTRRSRGGQRLIDGADLARFVGEINTARETANASARNQLSGIVTAITRDKVTTQVEMRCGPHRVVSLISTEAADDLSLEPGVMVVASIKATSVVVELPR